MGDKEKKSVDFEHGEHAIYEKGMKIESSKTPFHPKATDLPKLSMKQQLAEELHKEDEEMDKMMEIMLEEDEELKKRELEEIERTLSEEDQENERSSNDSSG